MTKTEKYLTEMKELPDFEDEAKTASEDNAGQDKDTLKAPVKKPAEVSVAAIPAKGEVAPKKPAAVEPNSDENNVAPITTPSLPEQDAVSLKYYSVKDIILGVINLLAVVFLIILLTKLPVKAKELYELNTKLLQHESSLPVNSTEIEEGVKKIEELNKLYVDESGVVEFVGEIDKLKANGKIINLMFASQIPIKDKTENFGYPIIIELRAESLDAILPDLEKIRELPYLFRPISLETVPARDVTPGSNNLTVFRYGILLYVNEKLGQN